jgi:hypothetical protein
MFLTRILHTEIVPEYSVPGFLYRDFLYRDCTGIFCSGFFCTGCYTKNTLRQLQPIFVMGYANSNGLDIGRVRTDKPVGTKRDSTIYFPTIRPLIDSKLVTQ